MMPISEITKAAKDFARSKDNEDIRLVRSVTSFMRYAGDNIEEKKNGDIVVTNNRGNEIGYWWSKIENGVICAKAPDFKKFTKLLEDEVSNTKEPVKRRGRPPKEKATKVPGKRGRPPKVKNDLTQELKAMVSNKKTSTSVKALIVNLRALADKLETEGI